VDSFAGGRRGLHLYFLYGEGEIEITSRITWGGSLAQADEREHLAVVRARRNLYVHGPATGQGEHTCGTEAGLFCADSQGGVHIASTWLL
jgi:hypothetical protein